MFELCIKESDALLRHRAAPLAAERERFITHMLECGSSRTNARTAAAHLLRFVFVLPMNKLRNVSEKELDSAANRWVNNRQRYSDHRPGPSSIFYFRWIARKWLRFIGRLLLPRRPRLEDYTQRMKAELGLAQTTIYERRLRAANFLRLRTLILLMHGTGARPRKVISLRVDSFDFRQRLVTLGDRRVGRARTIPFGSNLKKHLLSYLRMRRATGAACTNFF
jgi:integrase